MSINDPDGESYKQLTHDEFINLLLSTGWCHAAAEIEWLYFSNNNTKTTVSEADLEW